MRRMLLSPEVTLRCNPAPWIKSVSVSVYWPWETIFIFLEQSAMILLNGANCFAVCTLPD